MAERIGLVGFVNTEEILADTIKQQTPNVVVDGYEVLPNEAFGRIVDNRYQLYGVDPNTGAFGFSNLDKLNQLTQLGYSAVNLGPIPAAFIAGDTIDATGYDYIGPRRQELAYELDKTKITEIFKEERVLPPTKIVTKADSDTLTSAIDELGGKVVVKFVGEYPKYYSDSETRRVRFLSEFENSAELMEFARNSIADSGKLVVQKLVEGQQFSYTCLVDANGAVFSLGENICYKHRFDGDEGPLCDGTGAATINNTVPELVSPADSIFIRDSVVKPYCEYLANELGTAPKTFLNLDLIKAPDGAIYLLEVNHREAGGHTMSNLLIGLQTPLAEVFQATQEARLSELKPVFKYGASIVVSAFPDNFPHPFASEKDRPTLTIPKLRHDDDVRLYTGWVDVLSESEDTVVAKTYLSPTMLFAAHARNISEARQKVYERMGKVVPTGFAFRTDIGRGVGAQ